MQTDEIITIHLEGIKDYASLIKDDNFQKQYYENYLTILGYSYRLDNPSQRIFYTFQEAVYAIDLAKKLKDKNSLELNAVVYILVIDTLLSEYLGDELDEEEKNKAINTYKKIEEKRAKENQKYHIYQ